MAELATHRMVSHAREVFSECQAIQDGQGGEAPKLNRSPVGLSPLIRPAPASPRAHLWGASRKAVEPFTRIARGTIKTNRHLKDFAQPPQTARANAIAANLVVLNRLSGVEQTQHTGVGHILSNNLATAARLLRAPGKVFVLKQRNKSRSRRALRNALTAAALVIVLPSANVRAASANHGQTWKVAKQTHYFVPAGDPSTRRHNPHEWRGIRKKLFASTGRTHGYFNTSSESSLSFEPSGVASVYSDKTTASGQPMDPKAMTAAHRTLPFGTEVTVINHGNGRSAVVRINDRGPFVRGRVIDLSPAAALALGVDGLASVSLIVGSIDGSKALSRKATEELPGTSSDAVAFLALRCADQFRALPDADARTTALVADKDNSYEAFPKALITLPDKRYPDSNLAAACAGLILASPRSADLRQ
jgi:rare lipoprotein A